MKGDVSNPRALRFGPYTLDLRSRELTRRGRSVRLAEKPFVVLKTLVEAPREVVTREALRDRLWPDGTFVDFDNNLNSAVATLREILRDSARRPRYIETLPRLGYRFVAEVTYANGLEDPGAQPDAGSRPGPPPAPAPRTGWSGWRTAALAAVMMIAALAGAALRGTPDPAATHAEAASSIGAAAPVDPGAKRAYFRGLYLADRDGAENLTRALESFTRAARLEPQFAPAEAERAEVLSRLAFMPGRNMEADLAEARFLARQALGMDDALPGAHRVLAMAALHLDWDYPAARRELGRALELDPSDGLSHLAAATLLSAAGRHDEAIAEAERAVETDPSSNLIRADLGWFYLAAGRYEDSIRACREALDLEPQFRPALNFLVLANEKLGRVPQAAAAAEEILELEGPPGGTIPSPRALAPEKILDAYHDRNLRRAEKAYAEDRRSALWLALAHAEMDHRSEALRYLREAFETRGGWLVFAAGFPQFRGLRGDPEFDGLVGRLGFPRPGADSGGGPPTS